MRFAILGPLEVWRDGEPVAVGGPQQRALLAALLVHANRVVSTDRLIDYLWGDDPPRRARALLHGCVADLRKVLREGDRQPLRTRHPGYVLELAPGELDADEFEQLVADARAAGSPQRAAPLLYRSLALWRGPVLDGVATDGLLPAVVRLTERRLEVIEERIEVDLRLGRHAGLVVHLRDLVHQHPLRERLWLLLMRAQAEVGRRADALATYRELRAVLADQLGVEPGAAVRRLHRRILAAEEPTSAEEPSPEEPSPEEPSSEEPSSEAASSEESAVGATPTDPAVSDPPSAPGDPTTPPGAGPPAAPTPPPAQVPAAVSAFTGRADHLKWLDELAADERSMPVAVVTGTAGVGKTALVCHWAHRVRNRFPDGQLYVDLRGFAGAPPISPLVALTGFLHALGVPAGQTPVDPDAATGLYRSLLAGRRVLVVLDNAASAEQVRPLLPGTPGCLAVVTSRHRLAGLVARDGARRLTLSVLSEPEAETLLSRLLGKRVTAEPAAAAELARRCAYLPLALRIAAADVPGSLRQQVARLRGTERLDALTIDGDPDSAVRGAFDLSYRALDPAARRMFRLLGAVPATTVTAPAAAALAGLPPPAADRGLTRLAAAHLLEPAGDGRYGCHDLLRSYAAERAREEEEPAARQAAVTGWLTWYVRQVDAAARVLNPEMLRLPSPYPTTAGPADPAAALAWLDEERPNLLAAVRHAAAHGPAEPGWLLADGLRGYFWLRMYHLDWVEVATAGLAAATAAGDVRGQAAARLSLGDAYGRRGSYLEALAHYRQALTGYRQLDATDGESAVLGNLGNVHWWAGDLAAAADHYRQALASTGRGAAGQAVNLGNLGAVYWDMGDLAASADHHRRALALDRELGSLLGEAVDLGNLGRVELELGHVATAREHLTRALARHREIGDRSGEAEATRLLALTHLAGAPRRARLLAQRAVRLATESGSARYEADAHHTLGDCLAVLGRLEEAADAYQRALAMATRSGSRYPQIAALTGLARVLPDPGRARSSARRAVRLARRYGFRLLTGYALAALARAHHRLGEAAEEEAAYREARAVFTVCGSVAGLAALAGGDRPPAPGRPSRLRADERVLTRPSWPAPDVPARLEE